MATSSEASYLYYVRDALRAPNLFERPVKARGLRSEALNLEGLGADGLVEGPLYKPKLDTVHCSTSLRKSTNTGDERLLISKVVGPKCSQGSRGRRGRKSFEFLEDAVNEIAPKAVQVAVAIIEDHAGECATAVNHVRVACGPVRPHSPAARYLSAISSRWRTVDRPTFPRNNPGTDG